MDIKGSGTTRAPVMGEDVCRSRLRRRGQSRGFLGGTNAADWAAEKTTSLMACGGICVHHYHHTQPGDPQRSQQCHDIPDKETDCCGEEPLTSTAGNTEIHDVGSGGLGRMKAPH